MRPPANHRSFQGQLKLDTVGKYLELDVRAMITARVQAQLANTATWGGAVLGFDLSVVSEGGRFDEEDNTNRLSDEGLSGGVDVAGAARMRVRVITASSTSGALADVFVGVANPYSGGALSPVGPGGMGF